MQDDRSFGGSAGPEHGRGGAASTATGARSGAPRGGAENLEQRADEAMNDAAETLQAAADRLEGIAERIPRKGIGVRAGAAGESTADTLESIARFLRDNDAAGLQRDLGRLVSGRPLSMLLLAVGAGFVAGKVLR
jgi:hypothetical protein